ncbi:MAG: PorT family protein [Sphingomonadales bacterium]|nr:PorT family protein [Sphingomonadales bacterium]
MKAILLTLLFAGLFSVAANAQFHLGIKAGTNVTKVEGRSFQDEFSYGYQLGAFAEIKLSKQLTLQPELLINQYKAALDTNYNNLLNNALRGLSSVKLDYLSIPILLNYKLGGGFISLQAGPQFGILFDKSNSFGQNAQNAFKQGDLSMLGGIQLKVGIFRINGRYFIGLSDINDLTNDSRWKNQGFQLSIGMALL